MVELDNMKYTLSTYQKTLQEVKDSLDLETKQRRIAATAELWLMANPTEKQPRFDVIEIYQDEGIVRSIHHIENAF